LQTPQRSFGGTRRHGENVLTALKLMHDDIFDKKTLSRRSKWFLLSGEELELWMLKTALGLFHSGNAAKERSSLKAEQTINPECYNILYSSTLPIPCGLYVEPIQISERAKIQWQPASDLGGTRMIILRMTYLSFALTLLFDPASTYGSNVTDSRKYRPSWLIVRNDRRTHNVMLTWPPAASTERRIALVGY
jgi:hypothetical protein